MRTVDFYHFPNGQSPVKEFLDSLTGKASAECFMGLAVNRGIGGSSSSILQKTGGQRRNLGSPRTIWK